MFDYQSCKQRTVLIARPPYHTHTLRPMLVRELCLQFAAQISPPHGCIPPTIAGHSVQDRKLCTGACVSCISVSSALVVPLISISLFVRCTSTAILTLPLVAVQLTPHILCKHFSLPRSRLLCPCAQTPFSIHYIICHVVHSKISTPSAVAATATTASGKLTIVCGRRQASDKLH